MSRILNILLSIVCVVLVAALYFPSVYLIPLSFSSDPFIGVPGAYSAEWYTELFADAQMWHSLGTSIVLGIMNAAIVAPLSLWVAHLFQNMKQKAAFVGLVLLPLFTPGVVLGAALLIFVRMFGVLPSFWTVLLVDIIYAFPFAFLVLVVTLSRFNWTFLEAARNLGASGFKTFLDIEFPIVRGGVMAAAVVSFLLSFNEFIRTYLLRGTTELLTVYIYAVMTAHASIIGRVLALSSLVLILSFVLLFIGFLVGARKQIGELF